MTWTLLILVLMGNHTTMSTDMKFVDEASCRQAGPRIADALSRNGVEKPVIICVPTPGRE